MAFPLRIGSRASRLALLQAEAVARGLLHAHGLDKSDIRLESISTKGDRIKEKPLWEMGGKGLFTENIESQLLRGDLDLAVHSLKDMPTKPTNGLRADIVLERGNARDMLILSPKNDIDDVSVRALKPAGRIGTCAPRRMAQLLWMRSDLKVMSLRGNVETRLSKLESGDMDAIVIACAGLERLEITPDNAVTLSEDEMLPAAGQGVIAVQYREEDDKMRDFLAPLHHQETGLCVATEKSFLEVLDGSCVTPAGSYARAHNGRFRFTGRLLSLDGTELREVHEEADVANMGDAIALGRRAGEALLRQTPQRRV